MTRKDYLLLSAALRDARRTILLACPAGENPANLLMGHTVCCLSVNAILQRENRAFDGARFLSDCGAQR